MRQAVVYATVLFNCVVYTATLVTWVGSVEDGLVKTFVDMGNLDGVTKVFTNSEAILPAWLHFLAFDLTVGNYLVEKNIAADPAGLSQLLMAPVLLLTLLDGPLGVLTYTAMRISTGLFVNRHPAAKTS